jgi:aminoglycoside phosphotransferase (APT) family kinase protein
MVHGDLLGQNILIGLDCPPAVIDWEYAVLGDPAHDLAIVTRGAKRPFQLDRGLDKLLDAYHRHGGRDGVSREHVRVHELCMCAGWYRAALAGANVHRADQERGRLRGLLAHAQRES